MSRLDDIFDEFNAYIDWSTTGEEEAKQKIEAYINAQLADQKQRFVEAIPERAVETKNLGKDYSGYSRGYNACRDEILAQLNKEGS